MAENHKLKLVGIRKETANTNTYFFEKADQEPYHYRAGQFLTVILNRSNRELRRSYSFSSTPGIDPKISITVREIHNGEVSRFLSRSLAEGSELHTLAPAGLFTFEPVKSERDILLFAAGSGIVPVFSLLKQILRDEPGSNLILLTQNRSEKEIIFRDQLTEIFNRNAAGATWISLSSDPQGLNPQRLNADILEEILEKYLRYPVDQALVFICGPLPFMRMIEFTLKTTGFGSHQIRREIFMFDKVPEPSFFIDETPRNLQIRIGDKEHRISIAYPQSILQACLDAGIQVPYSCRGGRCSSCIAVCTSGEVKMTINEVLTNSDLAKNLVLTCVGYALTDLRLEIKIRS